MFNASYTGSITVARAAAWSVLIVAVSIAPPCPAAEPSAAALRAVVQKHLQRIPDYRPGDLITRGEVEPIFNELIDSGAGRFVGSEGLYQAFLPYQSYLAQFSRTPAGKRFLREVAEIPEAYDRLERLSWVPAAQSWLKQMAESKEGAEIFRRLMSEEGLKKIESEFAHDSRLSNIRLPTNHVRTEQELLVRLEEMMKANASGNRPRPTPDK